MAINGLKNGADPNSSFGSRPVIELAAFHGCPEIVDALVLFGAEITDDTIWGACEMDVTDYMIQCDEDEERYLQVFKILVVNGAKPTPKGPYGREPIDEFDKQVFPKIYAFFKSLKSAENLINPARRGRRLLSYHGELF